MSSRRAEVAARHVRCHGSEWVEIGQAARPRINYRRHLLVARFFASSSTREAVFTKAAALVGDFLSSGRKKGSCTLSAGRLLCFTPPLMISRSSSLFAPGATTVPVLLRRMSTTSSFLSDGLPEVQQGRRLLESGKYELCVAPLSRAMDILRNLPEASMDGDRYRLHLWLAQAMVAQKHYRDAAKHLHAAHHLAGSWAGSSAMSTEDRVKRRIRSSYYTAALEHASCLMSSSRDKAMSTDVAHGGHGAVASCSLTTLEITGAADIATRAKAQVPPSSFVQVEDADTLSEDHSGRHNRVGVASSSLGLLVRSNTMRFLPHFVVESINAEDRPFFLKKALVNFKAAPAVGAGLVAASRAAPGCSSEENNEELPFPSKGSSTSAGVQEDRVQDRGETYQVGGTPTPPNTCRSQSQSASEQTGDAICDFLRADAEAMRSVYLDPATACVNVLPLLLDAGHAADGETFPGGGEGDRTWSNYLRRGVDTSPAGGASTACKNSAAGASSSVAPSTCEDHNRSRRTENDYAPAFHWLLLTEHDDEFSKRDEHGASTSTTPEKYESELQQVDRSAQLPPRFLEAMQRQTVLCEILVNQFCSFNSTQTDLDAALSEHISPLMNLASSALSSTSAAPCHETKLDEAFLQPHQRAILQFCKARLLVAAANVLVFQHQVVSAEGLLRTAKSLSSLDDEQGQTQTTIGSEKKGSDPRKSLLSSASRRFVWRRDLLRAYANVLRKWERRERDVVYLEREADAIPIRQELQHDYSVARSGGAAAASMNSAVNAPTEIEVEGTGTKESICIADVHGIRMCHRLRLIPYAALPSFTWPHLSG
ncbi:unnamed protein product [Amoebophrya sp. A120]|nr:unnamed protein product [Amoebophrya sp. A120]|eukprot:GSA120T00017994001.1